MKINNPFDYNVEKLSSWIEIDLDAIVHNIGQIQRFVSPVALCPVIKADAYGHGAVEVAKVAIRAGVKNLSVATVSEGIKLRNAGIRSNIIILGPTMPYELIKAVENNLTLTVHSLDEFIYYGAVGGRLKKIINVHYKLDTGMARLGTKVIREETDSLLDFLYFTKKTKYLNIVGLSSHFATAELADTSFMEEQYKLFRLISDDMEKKGMNIIKHICASGSIVTSPHMHMDMVRPGALIYGLFPSVELENPLVLYPAMSVKARVIFLNSVEKGESVGYERTWIAQRKTNTAVIAYGYADGYSTSYSNNSYVTIKGFNCPVIGRVCMDQTIVDITDVPEEIKKYDVAHVIGGEGPSIMELSKLGGLGSREIQCLVTASRRAPRAYFEGGEITKVEFL